MKFLAYFFGFIVFLVVVFFSFPRIMGLVAGADDSAFDDSDLVLSTVDVPEAENGFYDLVKLSDVLKDGKTISKSVKIEIPSSINDLDYLESYDWDEGVVKELIDKNEEALKVFSDAAQKPQFQYIYMSGPNDISPTMPVVGMNAWRQASRLSGIKAIYLMKQGRDKEAFAEAMQLIEIGNDIEKSSNVMTLVYLIGLGIKDSGIDVMKILIDKTKLDSKRLAEIQRVIKGYEPVVNVDTKKVEYATSRLAINTMLDEIRQDASLFDVPVNNYYFKPNKTLKMKADSVRRVIEFYKSSCSVSPQVSEEITFSPWKMYFTDNAIGKLIFSMTDLSLDNAKLKRCSGDMRLDMLDLLLALKRYRLERGEYPDSLEEMVPDFFDNQLIDIFNDKQIKFDSDRMIIYSVGMNFLDDNAKDGSDDLVMSFNFSVTESEEVDKQEVDLTDSDDDGLLDFEEAWYGTEINNADSDGDGYYDGDEVNGGYNPSGSGKIGSNCSNPMACLNFIENIDMNSQQDIYKETLFFDEDLYDYVRNLESISEAFEDKNDSEIKEMLLSELLSSKSFDRTIIDVQINIKQCLTENEVYFKYRVNYEGGQTSGEKELILVLVDNEWKISVVSIIKMELGGEFVPLYESKAFARDTKRISDVKQIMTALELYYADHGYYPDNISFGGLDNYYWDIPSNSASDAGICGDFGDYQYVIDEDGQDYELKYCLEIGLSTIPSGVNIANSHGIANKGN